MKKMKNDFVLEEDDTVNWRDKPRNGGDGYGIFQFLLGIGLVIFVVGLLIGLLIGLT